MFQEFKELLLASSAHNVRYLIADGYAVPDGSASGDGRERELPWKPPLGPAVNVQRRGSRRRRHGLRG
jgi:hypothetical protein